MAHKYGLDEGKVYAMENTHFRFRQWLQRQMQYPKESLSGCGISLFVIRQ